jgi:tetratricopeptide (TPR) repeat protein
VPEGTDDPRLSAEGELSLARVALADGDLSHAAGHVATALAFAPTMPEVHEALAQLAARGPGRGIDLFPMEGPVFVGTVVARAHLLAAAGRRDEALELLAGATAHVPLADWAGVPWIADPDLAPRLDPDLLTRVLARVCGALADPVPEGQRAPLRPYLGLASHATRAYPTHGVLLGAASALARRLGEPALAVRWAEQGAQVAPSKLTEVWLGYAYRSAGQVENAIQAWQRALRHEPDDLSIAADIANTLADAGRIEEAHGWAERALAQNPEYDCAVHTAHRLRFLRDGDVAHLVGLVDFARTHPIDSHEHSDLADACHGEPWLGHVPAAGEAVINILRQVLERESDLSGGRLALSNLEPPSAMATLGRHLTDLTLTIQQLLEPDVRSPRRAVGLRLWTYDGTTARPALPPPAPASATAVAELAHPVWPHPAAAYDRAVRLAAVPRDDLLATLVHPPAPPRTELGQALARHDPSLWVRTVQVWACLGLLHHGADEPWGPSTRRRLLVDLAFGVEDWTTEAAVFAMVTAAWMDPSARSDVAALIRERLADVAQVSAKRPVTIAWSLARLALVTPQLAPGTIRLAREIVAAEEPAAGDEQPRQSAQPGLLRRIFRRGGG